MTRFVKASTSVFVAIAVLLLSSNLLADDTIAPARAAKLAILILYRDAVQNGQATMSAIQAGVSDLDVDFRIVWQERSPFNKSTAAATARQMLDDSGALLVIWCDAIVPREVNLLLRGASGNEHQSRPIDVTAGDGTTETLAVILRSWVTAAFAKDSDASPVEPSASWSEGGSTHLSPDDTSSKQKKPSEQIDENEPSEEDTAALPDISQLNVSVSQRRPLSTGAKRLLVEVSPAIRIQSGDHLALFGGDFVMGVRAAGGLFMFAGITLYLPTRDEASGVTLEISRYPAKLGGRFAFSLGSIELGPSLALEIDTLVKTIEIEDPERVEEGNGAPEVEISLVPMIFCAIPVWKRIRILVAAGGEILLNERELVLARIEGDPIAVHDPWPVQPTFYLGISLLLF